MNQVKQSILCAIDFSEASDRALLRALDLAAERPGTDLEVIFVTQPLFPADAVDAIAGFNPKVDIDAELQRLRAHVEACAVERVRAQGPIAIGRVRVHVRVGAPAEEIVQLAGDLDADLIVVATHGRRGAKRLLLGSVAESVVRNAPCPVLVVRDKAEAPKIEPACAACLEQRKATNGVELWCARHSEHHVRGHRLTYISNRFDSEPAVDSLPGS